jgi:chromosomal replication initiator protein
LPEDLETIWDAASKELRSAVSDDVFHFWLEPLRPASIRDGTLYLKGPKHVRRWARERYGSLLAGAAARACGATVAVELVPDDWRDPEPLPRTAREGAAQWEELLNPKYTFDQFVIGDENRLAHAAALAVAEQPAHTYNPLFLHGPPGLGKTHLLHAIGNYIQLHGLGLRVRYATAEAFTTQFIRAMRRDEGDAFKQRFREADVLLIDDVQFLAQKTRTREEFFHTFNALYESGRQLVLTSDRHPGELSDLEARLTERFQCGLVADLSLPDLGVRLAILRKRATLDAVEGVSDETLAAIAAHVRSSVRALEGALVKTVAYASLRNEPASPELARRALRRLEPAARPAPGSSVRKIQDATAERFGLGRDDLLRADRRPQVALARQVAMYLARELSDETLPAIGRSFGRNHSTILHAHRKIARELRKEGEARHAVEQLRERLADRL